jgi:hypothetical protein
MLFGIPSQPSEICVLMSAGRLDGADLAISVKLYRRVVTHRKHLFNSLFYFSLVHQLSAARLWYQRTTSHLRIIVSVSG